MQDSAGTLFEDEFPSATDESPDGPARDLLIVEADGGSRGNPGHAGYGALVRDPKTGAILVEKAGYIGIASNNVAEYSGLLAGLTLADEIDSGCRILVKMDSKLVVEQMSGRWKIKHADMQKLAGQARSTVDPRRVRYEWIPREKNKDADRLSNEAMDAGMAGVEWKPKSSPSPQEDSRPGENADVGSPRIASGTLHHVEIWIQDLNAARSSMGWLFERLGFLPKDSWENGASWAGNGTYLVLEAGPGVLSGPHERRRQGVNHLAFNAGTRAQVDLLARRAASHGWTLLFRDRHPYAGGREHYAAYLENAEGFEVELVADQNAQ
ncbi:reverse transcriptase-like protein [Arthrobacter sp. Soil782]|uniref:reverse transcriptase-like protein n=1 Tax=Arthrobacter sp. Soil782 TaxID=1736410 RepID=UPI000AB0A713